MAKVTFKSVGEYLAKQPPEARSILRVVQSAIRSAVPEAQECISYQIPSYKLHGTPVIYFAAWKQHYSLYPATNGVLEAFKKDLAGYEVSKGTIRFPLTQPVPVKLIRRIARFRAELVIDRAKPKLAATKRSSTKGGERAPSSRRRK